MVLVGMNLQLHQATFMIYTSLPKTLAMPLDVEIIQVAILGIHTVLCIVLTMEEIRGMEMVTLKT